MGKTFVCYSWFSKLQHGFGNVDWDGPIRSRDDLAKVKDHIMNEFKDDYGHQFKSVVVLSWQEYD